MTLEVNHLQARYAQTSDVGLAHEILRPFRPEQLKDVWDRILDLARPSVRFRAGGHIKVGGSKLGGLPDVPAEFAWPHRTEDEPLCFVAQINLADVQRACPNQLLPSHGLLSFYYDSEGEPWGFDPKDKSGWMVRYHNGNVGKLRSAPASLSEERPYPEVPLEPWGELTLPETDSLEVERVRLSQRQAFAYSDLHLKLIDERGEDSIHRCLGWSDAIQHDPPVVQLPANGINAGGPGAYESAEGKRLIETRDVWRLLLQVDSDEAAGMEWGDSGMLYYMMREHDLRASRWEDAWLSLQST